MATKNSPASTERPSLGDVLLTSADVPDRDQPPAESTQPITCLLSTDYRMLARQRKAPFR